MSANSPRASVSGRLEVRAEVPRDVETILSPDALRFLESLVIEFEPRRRQLLAARAERQRRVNSGELPTFAAEPGGVREREWLVAPIPPELQDRRVEIVGPTDRSTMVSALNSGASAFVADFEDSTSPTWSNVIRGQLNLRDAAAGTLRHRSSEGREYGLQQPRAALMVRPRGWHLVEKHIELDGRPASASLVDVGLALFHNARPLLQKGSAPCFYLPKLESSLEARLWNDVFVRAQRILGVPQGTIRATVLIETVFAAFEMDEILYELRDHSAGLGCDCRDHAFSLVSTFRSNRAFTLPDREPLTTVDCMRRLRQLMVETCHRRGIHAIAGTGARVALPADEEAGEPPVDAAAEMERDAAAGCDGTWVAHPDLVPVARRIFDARMPTPNQLHLRADARPIASAELLEAPAGPITVEGVRRNATAAIEYLAAWLGGNGCVRIGNRIEDAASAELCRAQLWQWLHHDALLSDGTRLTAERFARIFDHVVNQLRMQVGEPAFTTGRYALAARLVLDIALRPEFTDFMSVVGYQYLE